MKISEVLDMYAESATLDETLAQVTARIKKRKGEAKDAAGLARIIAGDQALTQSVPAIDTATDQEKADYTELLKDQVVSQAISGLPSNIKSSFEKLSKLPTPEKSAPEAPVAKPDALKQIDPQAKKMLDQMQKEWFGAKTRQQKLTLVGQWSKEPVRARMYKFGLNQGLFAVPAAA